jgi:hypothetical protein
MSAADGLQILVPEKKEEFLPETSKQHVSTPARAGGNVLGQVI